MLFHDVIVTQSRKVVFVVFNGSNEEELYLKI